MVASVTQGSNLVAPPGAVQTGHIPQRVFLLRRRSSMMAAETPGMKGKAREPSFLIENRIDVVVFLVFLFCVDEDGSETGGTEMSRLISSRVFRLRRVPRGRWGSGVGQGW